MSFAAAMPMFLVAGLAGGVLLGLIGVGMALVTVPLLIMVLPLVGIDASIGPATAVGTSMAVVSLGSVSSVMSHHRRGNVDWSLCRLIVPASLAGVLLGSLVASRLSGPVLRIVFAVFMVVMAVRMLRAGQSTALADDRPTRPAVYRMAGGLIGVAGSFIGAGGNVFMIPFLNSRGLKIAHAVATATALGLPVSLLGSAVYALQPVALSSPSMLGYIYLPAFVGLSLGSLIAAPLGARLAATMDPGVLRKIFAAILLAVAAKLLLQG